METTTSTVRIMDIPALEPAVQSLFNQRKFGEINQEEYEEAMQNLGYTLDEAREMDPGRLEG